MNGEILLHVLSSLPCAVRNHKAIQCAIRV